VLAEGNDLVVSAWDILSGDAKPGANVLIYDDAGDHAAMQAAQMIAEAGDGRGDDPRPQLLHPR
jgi:N-methyl-L-proline demethylase